ncbi:MAG: peptidoglycan editing factor PgeF [Arcobacteraceae bacterium]
MIVLFTTAEDKNLAYHVTQDFTSVNTARQNLAKKYNFDIDKLQYMNQVHSNIVKTISHTTNPQTCDALITNEPNTPLLVMVADCIPILFYDEVLEVIGVAHAGRVGTFENISANTIKKMCVDYKCAIENIKVVLGPSIQKCCYEVSQEMVDFVKINFGIEFVNNKNIDLQGINKKQLLDLGIEEKNIEISTVCTKCSNQPYFSYRNDNSCGRFAGLIMIEKKR